MSLRAEYSHQPVFNDSERKWEVTAFYRNFPKQARAVGFEVVDFEFQIEACANRLISAHMEKVKQKNHHD